MIKLIAGAFVGLFLALPAYGQNAPQTLQLFGCALNDGKSVEDVWSLAENFRAAMPKLNNQDEALGVFVWLPFRGASPYDYIWGVVNTDLLSMQQGLASYYESGVGAEFDQQFGATGDCISGIFNSHQVKEGQVGNTADRELDAVVELFGCTINDGSDMDDVHAATKNWQAQVKAINSKALNTYEGFMLTTYRGGTGQSDFIWLGTYPDMATWAQGETDYNGSKQGQDAEAKFAEVSRCTNGLWGGYWVVPPAAG